MLRVGPPVVLALCSLHLAAQEFGKKMVCIYMYIYIFHKLITGFALDSSDLEDTLFIQEIRDLDQLPPQLE